MTGIETKDCSIHFGKVTILGATQVIIKKKPNGIFYASIQSLYTQDEYQALSLLCWETKREPFKILNSQGQILKDFHVWALLIQIDTILKVDDMITNNFTFKLLNKIK